MFCKNLNTKPKIKNIKFQLGDMFKTHGSNTKISKKYKFKNLIDITKGIKEIISKNWFINSKTHNYKCSKK